MLTKIKVALSSIWFSILMFLPDEFSKFRIKYYNKKGCNIDLSCSISPNVRIRGNVKLGKNTSIAQNCTITGGSCGVEIGEDVMIAPNVVIVAFSHPISNITIPMWTQEDIEEKVIIEDDVWISANSTISAGVKIGKGAVIGANSFVNKDVTAYTVVGGVPAKLLKSRN